VVPYLPLPELQRGTGTPRRDVDGDTGSTTTLPSTPSTGGTQ
jgi:hypothetical protein